MSSLEADLTMTAGYNTLQEIILQRQQRNEARAASTIGVEHRTDRLLVTERADGGGGPFSRMTKFTRLDFNRGNQRLGTTLTPYAR